MEMTVWRLPVPSFGKTLRSVVTIEMPFRQIVLMEMVRWRAWCFSLSTVVLKRLLAASSVLREMYS
jgi:hypothetical protein